MNSCRNPAMYFLFTCALIGHAMSAGADIRSGHSAAWYDPERAGEGWVLEVLDEDRALAYWFTYDEEGNQRWFFGSGSIVDGVDGELIEIADLFSTDGGRFGDAFDPAEVTKQRVGSASFTFESCNAGRVEYSVSGQAGSMVLQRLSQTMGAGCEPINGNPGQPVKPYAGHSGSWYDPGHDGEGFVLHWLARDAALVYWFSYDTNGNQAWMYGVGHALDGNIVFPELYSTSGPRFGGAFDPADLRNTEWGSLEMTLDCEAGSVAYDSVLPAFGQGGQDLARLTRLKDPACPYVRPHLADLYEFELMNLPVPDEDTFAVRSIADDGTVAGVRLLPGNTGAEVVVFTPGGNDWAVLSGEIVSSEGPVVISNDGERVLANQYSDPEAPLPFEPVVWKASTGWRKLPGMDMEFSEMLAASKDLSRVVGLMSPDGDQQNELAFIWDEEGGQRQLPADFSVSSVGDDFLPPSAIANDGSVVVGNRTLPVLSGGPPGSNERAEVALRWVDESSPRHLKDPEKSRLATATVCDADCSIIFGEGYTGITQDEFGLAWFRTRGGNFGIFEPLFADNRFVFTEIQTPVAASEDGSIVIGMVKIVGLLDPTPPPLPIIWTQRTGTTHISELNAEIVTQDPHWELRAALDISSDGKQILLQVKSMPSEEGPVPAAAILRLTPKLSD